METSVQDRFASLFTSDTPPPTTDPDRPALFEREEQNLHQQPSRKVPDVAKSPRVVSGPSPNSAAADDLTSSDDDDYVSAFAQKPKMQSLVKKGARNSKLTARTEPGSDSHRYPRHAASQSLWPSTNQSAGKSSGDHGSDGKQKYCSPRKLPTMDKFGNPVTGYFCPFNLVKTFPYKYMVDRNDQVSKHFFASNKFFERKWDLYYVHPPESLSRHVVLLLPLHQVQHLVEEIGTRFTIEVSIPPFPFCLPFFDDGTPQPQLLGTTMSRADINDMQDKIPSPSPGHGEAPPGAIPAQKFSFEAFKARIDRVTAANKRRSTAVKKRKAEDRFTMIQDWCKQLRRTQRYLGLRPKQGQMQMPDPEMSWAEQDAFMRKTEDDGPIVLDPLDVNKAVPYPFEQEPIIICIDIESYERDHSLITEVGVSTLDTLDLVNVAPGQGGAQWMKHIRSRHFRLKGREHLINKDFVTGHPEDFQFGESEFVALDAIGNAIDSCFQWPFSVDFKHDGRLKGFTNDWETNATNEHSSGTGVKPPDTSKEAPPNDSHGSEVTTRSKIGGANTSDFGQRGPRERTILLLGHDLSGDLAYLAKLNSRVFSAPRPTTYPAPVIDPADVDNPVHSILEALDTAILYKVLTRDSQTRSLTTIMADLGRTAWFAHCGGNDARYTLEALIGLSVKARLQDDEEAAAQQATARQALEQDTWNVTAAAQDLNLSSPNETHNDGTGVTNNTRETSQTSQSPRDPATAWQAEKARRLAARLVATQKEVEEEFEAWDAALSPNTLANTNNPADDKECSPIPFTQVLESTHKAQDKKYRKKSNEEKRREWERRLQEEDGVSGPVDWAVGGKDG